MNSPPPRRPRKMAVIVCRGPTCGEQRNSAAVHAALVAELRARVQPGVEVVLRWQSCFGQCARGPNVMVREVRDGEDSFFLSFVPTAADCAALYHAVRPAEAGRIVDEHVIGGRVIEEFKKRD